MITVELDNFSLKEICQSGQCFRMYETEENTYELIAGDQYLKMTQDGGIVNFHCSDMEFICYLQQLYSKNKSQRYLSECRG